MRIVTCVLLGLGFAASPALAAGPVAPVRGAPAFFVRPPAGVIHVGPHAGRSTVRNGHYNYTTGLYAPWGWPGAYAGEGAGAPTQSQVFAPHTNVWYGPRPVGQGDVGYVTQPAIYDVQRELSRRTSFWPGPTK